MRNDSVMFSLSFIGSKIMYLNWDLFGWVHIKLHHAKGKSEKKWSLYVALHHQMSPFVAHGVFWGCQIFEMLTSRPKKWQFNQLCSISRSEVMIFQSLSRTIGSHSELWPILTCSAKLSLPTNDKRAQSWWMVTYVVHLAIHKLIFQKMKTTMKLWRCTQTKSRQQQDSLSRPIVNLSIPVVMVTRYAPESTWMVLVCLDIKVSRSLLCCHHWSWMVTMMPCFLGHSDKSFLCVTYNTWMSHFKSMWILN